MPSFAHRNPSYRRHRSSGQAIVVLNRQMIYLGPWKSKASREAYDRIIGEWFANGRRLPRQTRSAGAAPAGAAPADISVAELIVRFMEHAETYYRHGDGTQTDEIWAFRSVFKILNRLYGRTAAADFGPLALESCRNAMIEKGWVRRNINNMVGRIKLVFRWAVSREILPADVHTSLSTLAGLRMGRSDAKESAPVRPVADDVVEATIRHLSPTVAAMIQTQRLTGARPGEICSMRIGDIDRSGAVWLYVPKAHKTLHHGHARRIFIGPKAQAVLAPFMRKIDPAAYVFSPADAERERRDAMHAARVAGGTPPRYGNVPGSNRKAKPKHQPGESYDVGAYRRAITRACDKADRHAHGGIVATDEDRIVPRWHPHQLRHSAATEIRKHFGIESAQSVLGHANVSMTELYAEQDSESARRVAAAIG
jgi:integrase